MSVIPPRFVSARWLPPNVPPSHRPLDYPGFWREQPALVGGMFLLYIFAHAALELGAESLAVGAPRRLAWLPSAGLLFAVLLFTPKRTWLMWLVGAFVADLTVERLFAPPSSLAMAATISAARSVGPVLAGLLSADFLMRGLRMRRPLYFYAVLSLCCAAGSLIAGTVVALALSESVMVGAFYDLWLAETLAIYLGIVLVAPLILAWTVAGRRDLSAHWSLVVELALLVLFILVTVVLAINAEPGEPLGFIGRGDLLVLMLFVVAALWGGLRFDPRVVSVAMVSCAIALTVATGDGGGFLVAAGDPQAEILSKLQLFTLGMVQTVFVLNLAVAEGARAREDARMHQSIEGILVRMSSKFVNIQPGTLDRTLEESLHEIGEFVGADRSALWEIDAAIGRFFETHVALREGNSELDRTLRRGRLEEHPWALWQLEHAGQFVLIEPGKDVPPEAEEFRGIWPERTRAVAVTALFFDGRLTGAIGFEWMRREFRWSDDIVALLKIFGQLFATMQKRLQTEGMIDAYQQKLRSMARELSLSEERARRRTATDLHDGIGQNLAVAKIKLGQLQMSAGDEKHINVLHELIDDALSQSRYIIADLSPSILYDLGLAAAIRWLGGRTEHKYEHLKCSVEETGEAWATNEDSRVAIFRSVRELVQNAVKHADATHVSIHIDWRDDELYVCVSDNGAGFKSLAMASERGPEQPEGFGLFSVRESVSALGGELKVDSEPGSGAAISFTVGRRLAHE